VVRGQSVEFTTSSGQQVSLEAFYGLRYAEAKRFTAPLLYAYPENKTVDARESLPEQMCKWSPQEDDPGSEDCLFLDIYAPFGARNASVMVWIHGGGLVWGSKSELGFNGLKMFAAEGLVVVAINYRLNVFGFWTDPHDPSKGLWGLRDQIAALQWVQGNIQSFGGNPDSVTIFGQSAGGLSVTALYESPLASGLFHRGIAQSPGWQTTAQYQRSALLAGNSLGRACMEASQCSDLQCMQQLNSSWLLLACSDYTNPISWLTNSSAVFAGFDGDVLKAGLYEPVCNKEILPSLKKPQLMIGSLLHEWTYFKNFGTPVAGSAVEAFLQSRLIGYSEASANLRRCALEELKQPYVNDNRGPCGVEDCALYDLLTDLQFTLGAQLLSETSATPRYRYLMETADSEHGDELCFFYEKPSKHCAEGSTKAGQMLREYWTSFAKTGLPSSVLGPEWLPVQRSEDMLGVPMLYLNFTSHGPISAMRNSTFGSAKLLAGMACGKVRLESSNDGACSFAFE